jgi:hypothetical protein
MLRQFAGTSFGQPVTHFGSEAKPRDSRARLRPTLPNGYGPGNSRRRITRLGSVMALLQSHLPEQRPKSRMFLERRQQKRALDVACWPRDELLLHEPEKKGRLRLVAVEYIIPCVNVVCDHTTAVSTMVH